MADVIQLGKAAGVIVGSYLLGCVATGYYLVRWRTGQDLRRVGSGSTGGTNAGRVLGRWGLVVTGLVDILKGIVAVGVARYFGLDGWGEMLAGAAVVAGHVFPIQLRFQGGRGLGPALGALLVIDYTLVGLALGLMGVLWLLSRRRTLSLMVCLAAMPLFSIALGRPLSETLGLIPIAVIIVVGHRQRIAEELAGIRGRARS